MTAAAVATHALPEPDHCAESVVIRGVRWETYERLLKDIDDQHVRITYDQGSMEIMAPLPIHELYKKITARLLELYALEADIPICGLGNTTFRRKDLKKGLEPDECYYIANAEKVQYKKRLNLMKDPPPDLVLEIDIMSRSLKREPIYAALGVPEMWKLDESRIVPHHLSPAGIYKPAKASLSFPDLPMDQFNQFIQMSLSKSQHEAAKALQRWMRRSGRMKLT
jgi:Uma2 family endonuclease